ncbi:helix-turn-helix domain-containing protein [Latilactobacillus sakei]
MTDLVDNIKRYAKLRGMNLKRVATNAGLSESAIYNWRKHTPSKPTIKAVAEVLGVTYEDLTGEKAESNPTTIDVKAAIEDEHTLMTFDGKPIPPEDLEIMKRLLRGE